MSEHTPESTKNIKEKIEGWAALICLFFGVFFSMEAMFSGSIAEMIWTAVFLAAGILFAWLYLKDKI